MLRNTSDPSPGSSARVLFKGGRPGEPGLVRKIITDRLGRQITHWVRSDRLPRLHLGAGTHDNALQGEMFDEQGDPYPHLETRAGTSERQREAGRDALAEIERRLHLLRPGGDGAASLLGVRLARDFRANGGASLVGQSVNSPADLAVLAQVYRDPRFETLRAFYTDDAGRVVGEAAYTSRLPGAVQLPDDYAADMKRDMERFGASGCWVLHNHPSGSAEPSQSDILLTRQMGALVPGFRGHVVIDHNEYAHIDAHGESRVIAAPKLAGVNFKATPAVDHPVLGMPIGRPLDAATAAKRLQDYARQDAPVLIMTEGGSVGRVSLLASVPHGVLDAAHANTVRGMAWLRGIGRASGAGGNVFLATTKQDIERRQGRYVALIRAGLLTDVVDAEGYSMRERQSWIATPAPTHGATFATRRGGAKAAEPAPASDAAPKTPAATIRAAIRRAYGSLLDKLEAKGLVTLAQTEAEAIEAAARARAAKTGETLEDVLQSLRESVKNSLSPMKSVQANIRRGREALARTLDGKTSAHRAMYRNGLGWVDFVWGDAGVVKPSGKTKGAMGLAHIVEARQRKDGMTDADAVQLLDRLVRAISSGQEVRRHSVGPSEQVVVEHDGVQAILTKRAGSNAWLLSGWELKNPDALRAGNAAPEATPAEPTAARPGRGAGFAQIMNVGGLDIKRSTSGAIEGFFDPVSGQSFLVADGLTEAAAPVGGASWEAQRIRGAVAKALGFQAVEMDDEHGTSYLVLPGTPIRQAQQDAAHKPKQSQPATGNNGNFDPKNPDMTKAQPPAVLRIKAVRP